MWVQIKCDICAAPGVICPAVFALSRWLRFSNAVSNPRRRAVGGYGSAGTASALRICRKPAHKCRRALRQRYHLLIQARPAVKADRPAASFLRCVRRGISGQARSRQYSPLSATARAGAGDALSSGPVCHCRPVAGQVQRFNRKVRGRARGFGDQAARALVCPMSAGAAVHQIGAIRVVFNAGCRVP